MPHGQVDLMQALHDEHAAALWAFCVRLTGSDVQRAQDLTQETLLRAWRHPDVLDRSTSGVRAWLFTVARNLAIDDWRARRSRPELVTAVVPERSTSDDTEQMLVSWVIADALRQLSDEHRQVLVECFYRGRTVADTARRLGIPEGTVKSRTHYALRALRLTLEEMGVVS